MQQSKLVPGMIFRSCFVYILIGIRDPFLNGADLSDSDSDNDSNSDSDSSSGASSESDNESGSEQESGQTAAAAGESQPSKRVKATGER